MYYSKFWSADERVNFQIKGSSKMEGTGKAGFTIDYNLYTGDVKEVIDTISTTRKVFSMDDLKKAVKSIDDFIIEWKKRNKVESLKRCYRKAIDC